VEVEEKINDVDWLKPQGKSLYVLTTNSRSIKLWKMSHRTIKEVSKSAGKELAMPTLRVIEEGLIPK
jgi:serine/threonine-protein phosphatase 2A regulatory subunit B